MYYQRGLSLNQLPIHLLDERKDSCVAMIVVIIGLCVMVEMVMLVEMDQVFHC